MSRHPWLLTAIATALLACSSGDDSEGFGGGSGGGNGTGGSSPTRIGQRTYLGGCDMTGEQGVCAVGTCTAVSIRPVCATECVTDSSCDANQRCTSLGTMKRCLPLCEATEDCPLAMQVVCMPTTSGPRVCWVADDTAGELAPRGELSIVNLDQRGRLLQGETTTMTITLESTGSRVFEGAVKLRSDTQGLQTGGQANLSGIWPERLAQGTNKPTVASVSAEILATEDFDVGKPLPMSVLIADTYTNGQTVIPIYVTPLYGGGVLRIVDMPSSMIPGQPAAGFTLKASNIGYGDAVDVVTTVDAVTAGVVVEPAGGAGGTGGTGGGGPVTLKPEQSAQVYEGIMTLPPGYVQGTMIELSVHMQEQNGGMSWDQTVPVMPAP